MLRRPPLGHTLATAHDVAREFRVMSALAGTPVPVPRMDALCKDESVIGAPFVVMERVYGTSYRTASELETTGAARTRTISTHMVQALARLHCIDPVDVGLHTLGRPDGFLQRQVERWRQQLEKSSSRALPPATPLYRALRDEIPRETRAAIVHGDYRLDNLLVDPQDNVAAIIDWEMATLGDPILDLALLIVYGDVARLPGGSAISDAALASGYLDQGGLIAAYAAASGEQIADFHFYKALALFKLAAIVEGIHYRHITGKTVGDGFDTIGELTLPLLEVGLQTLVD